MHGILFKSMKDYVIENHGKATWLNVCKEADIDKRIYLTIDTYPDEELIRIFDATADYVGSSVPNLLESYGRFAAGNLLDTHRNIVEDDWDVLDLLANADDGIHDVLSARDQNIEPPELVCRRDDPTRVTVEYRSDRQLCFVAGGIIRGVADYYDTDVTLTETSCMHEGANHCEFVVEK